MTHRNQNDFLTDNRALGPEKIVPPEKTMTSYNVPGLPRPPGGWNRNLGINPSYAPDTCVINSGTI